MLPTTELDPFNCNILPWPHNVNCQAAKYNPRSTAPGSCSRLPPQFQAFCRALPPPDPTGAFNGATTYDPQYWPNTAAARNPIDFANARKACGQLGPTEFYNCLWGSGTKYPWYREFGETAPVINSAYFPCNRTKPWVSRVDSPTLTGEWKQVSPDNDNQYCGPKVWTRN